MGSKMTLHQSFTAMIEQNKGIIYKVANGYCQHKEDRNDLVQEIMVQLWRAFGKYDEQYQLSTWMYRISLNVAISFYRKSSKLKEDSTEINDDILQVNEDLAEQQQDENIRLLYKFIGGLNPLDKAIIILYLESHTHLSIADTLGISQTNVATKIARIKDKLKHQFSNKETK
jgi:RNA polymerase sigma factor (sigma-70 family)